MSNQTFILVLLCFCLLIVVILIIVAIRANRIEKKYAQMYEDDRVYKQSVETEAEHFRSDN